MILIAFIVITNATVIVGIVERQLSKYRYIFPTATLVSY